MSSWPGFTFGGGLLSQGLSNHDLGGVAKNLNFSRFTLNWREEPKNCGFFSENCESVRIVNVSQHQVHADHLMLFPCVKIRRLAKFNKIFWPHVEGDHFYLNALPFPNPTSLGSEKQGIWKLFRCFRSTSPTTAQNTCFLIKTCIFKTKHMFRLVVSSLVGHVRLRRALGRVGSCPIG